MKFSTWAPEIGLAGDGVQVVTGNDDIAVRTRQHIYRRGAEAWPERLLFE